VASSRALVAALAGCLALVGCAALAGCALPGTAGTGDRGAVTELILFGAASLRDALEGAATAYEAATPGVTLTISTDSSAALATQIREGAPADVFLSADTRQPEALAADGVVGVPVTFAGNALAVIVPSGNPAGLASPADLARPEVKVIAAGDEVPITAYATRLVANLASQPGYPDGFAAGYEANIVSREANVKAVVAKIELGEGDAAIAYRTDAVASTGVATLDVPPAAGVPVAYAGAVVAASDDVGAASAFLAWLAGPGGRAVLGGFGFLPAP
jgi:molybdate transport system substrate-binding protein